MVYLVPRAHPPFSTIPFGNGGSLPIFVEKEAGRGITRHPPTFGHHMRLMVEWGDF